MLGAVAVQPVPVQTVPTALVPAAALVDAAKTQVCVTLIHYAQGRTPWDTPGSADQPAYQRMKAIMQILWAAMMQPPRLAFRKDTSTGKTLADV